jgi:putative endonuclease
MPYYVYILQSKLDNTYYKGFTENPLKRLEQHNAGEMNYTSKKIPWAFVGLFQFETKKEALISEKKIKKYDYSRLEKLIYADKNILNIFLTSFPTRL